MKKRISDYLLDVSKYVLAGLFIVPLINKNLLCDESCLIAAIVVVSFLLIGLYFSKQKKNSNNNKASNTNRNKNFRKTKNTSNKKVSDQVKL